jgi:hypothetical protein
MADNYGFGLKSDFLKASHHGRDSGYHLGAVELIAPRITFVGRKPDTDASSKYRGQSDRVASTRYHGNIELRLHDNGTHQWFVDRRGVTPRHGFTLKSLKEQNRWQIWAIIVANTVFLYAVIEANAIELDGIRSVFTDTAKLVPFGLAFVVATVLNGLLPAELKARLVFLRWRNALPGHRAFSQYINSDPRIDPTAVQKAVGGSLPVDPVEQNRMWYRLYKTVENDPAVLHFSVSLGRCSSTKQRARTLTQALEGDVEHRDHEKPDPAGGDHPGKDRCADRVPADLRGALRDHQRVDA